MGKIHFVTLARLNRAVSKVASELDHHGLWNDRLQNVPVVLVPVGFAYGWQSYGGSGEISVPRVSLLKLHDYFTGAYTGLADVVRHEFAHALADTHRGLLRSRRFTKAFGRSHESSVALAYDAAHHVSRYAATEACEDFAETFMLFLRHRGILPSKHATPTITSKWNYVHELCRVVRVNRTRW
ncbi:MAG: hypothetical protein WCT04_09690 [Planctomycetota bacterium]